MTSEFGIAVHALVFLNHKKTIVSSEALAKNVCVNPVRIRKIMTKLKKGNLVSTKEGSEGGYIITKEGSEITLNDVSEVLKTKFVHSSWQPKDIDMDCLISSGMKDIMNGIYTDLNDLCKKSLNSITISDIDSKIFKTKL